MTLRYTSSAATQMVYGKGMATPTIPIKDAERIAKKYGFDQVIIVARKTGEGPDNGEAVTTYGIDKLHCEVAGSVGRFLKHKIMGWPENDKDDKKT